MSPDSMTLAMLTEWLITCNKLFQKASYDCDEIAEAECEKRVEELDKLLALVGLKIEWSAYDYVIRQR